MTRQLRLRILLVASVLLVTVAAACRSSSTQGGQGQADVGISATEIKLGMTDALSGPASAYASIAKGMDAYFKMINDQGGVNGRKITFIIRDDSYDPAKAVEQTKALVEQEKVFAIVGGLGTPTQSAVRDYMNQMKVPQAQVFTGASKWGGDHEQYKYTWGWQPDYVSEAKIYAKDILKNRPDGKIAVLYQNDDYGKDYLNGLQAGLGDMKSMIVKAESYETTAADVSSQVASLKASGADIFMVFATPKFAAQAIKAQNDLGWNPVVYNNSVSASLNTMLQAGAQASEGVISVVYLKDPTDPEWDNDEAMKTYKAAMAKYYPGFDVKDGYYYSGFASADTFVKVLKQMGSNLTRENLVTQFENMDFDNPYLLPGIKIKTGAGDYFPIEQEQLEKFQNGKWVRYGEVINARS